MKTVLILLVCLCVATPGLTTEQVTINPCIKQNDVIVITDVRSDDQDQITKLKDFFEEMTELLSDDTEFQVLSYPQVNSFSGSETVTSRPVYTQHQVYGVKQFIQACIDDRSSHPDINVALRRANQLIEDGRLHADKTVVIISYNRYVPPYVSSEEEEENEEGLETNSRIIYAQLGDQLRKKAHVLVYAIGTFENEFELTDLASCRDDRCIFKLDDFDDLSMEPILRGCGAD